MGCDIHAHAEIKVNGVWQHYNHPRIGRDYELFTRMAGVRQVESVTPISPPRGLPRNLSFTTKLDRKNDGVDGHSDSWLSSEEVAELCEWMEARAKKCEPKGYYYAEKELGYIFGNGWDFKKYKREDGEKGYAGQPRELEDARLVFWFDN